jgi:hypothetical protein
LHRAATTAIIVPVTFRFPFWLACLPPVAAIAVFAVGAWRLRRGRRGRLWQFAGILIGVVFGPMLFLDRVVVDDEGIEQTTGFWFAPTEKGIRFAGTRRVRIERERSGGRRNRMQDVWYAEDGAGGVQRLDPGDLWDLHADEIVTCLRARGIEVR